AGEALTAAGGDRRRAAAAPRVARPRDRVWAGRRGASGRGAVDDRPHPGDRPVRHGGGTGPGRCGRADRGRAHERSPEPCRGLRARGRRGALRDRVRGAGGGARRTRPAGRPGRPPPDRAGHHETGAPVRRRRRSVARVGDSAIL
ncbi:MAG: hypothetical protein AVDCRST_MAG38-815, partial [uncultured Solirubrobacteraceae bacterium]